jgi:hypothetical protein
MTPHRQSLTLFWLQVSTYLSAILFLLSTMTLLWVFVTGQMRALEQDRSKHDAMLSSHFKALKDHEAVMERLRR